MLFGDHLVVVRGGGDLATGVVHRLMRAGFPVVVTELEHPLAIRRSVAVATAVTDGVVQVDGIEARRVASSHEAVAVAATGIAAVIVSPQLPAFAEPAAVVVDARVAKRNLDTRLDQASLVVALGPGFTAGVDCHAVVETMRGHRLGRVIWRGSAAADTGQPGRIGGKSSERVIRSPGPGKVRWRVAIGDVVGPGDVLGFVAESEVRTPIEGVVRGLLTDGHLATDGLKIADVDPRADRAACFEISDKSRSDWWEVGSWRRCWHGSTIDDGSADRVDWPRDAEVVSLVGAGGKTTTLLRLGSELAGDGFRIVMTTTTKMGVDQLPDWAPARRAGEEWPPGEPVFVLGDVVGEKVTGVGPEYVDEIFGSGAVDHVIVEADGARRRPLKAPGSHEPVIPSATSVLVVIASLDAIGRPIREAAHRPEIVCRLTGRTPDDAVVPSDIAAVLAHRDGGLKDAPEAARVVAMVTGAVAGTEEAVAEIVDRLQRVDRIERVVVQGRWGGNG